MAMISSNFKQKEQFAYENIFLCLSGFEGCVLTKYFNISISLSEEVIPLMVTISILPVVDLIGKYSGDQNFYLIPPKSGILFSLSHFSLKLIS